MIDIEKDIGRIRLHCRYMTADQLANVVRHRLCNFVQLMEKIANKSGQRVLWTDKPRGRVTTAKYSLDREELNQIALDVVQNEKYDFIVRTPWIDDDYEPSIQISRYNGLRDTCYININFPYYYMFRDVPLK